MSETILSCIADSSDSTPQQDGNHFEVFVRAAHYSALFCCHQMQCTDISMQKISVPLCAPDLGSISQRRRHDVWQVPQASETLFAQSTHTHRAFRVYFCLPGHNMSQYIPNSNRKVVGMACLSRASVTRNTESLGRVIYGPRCKARATDVCLFRVFATCLCICEIAEMTGSPQVDISDDHELGGGNESSVETFSPNPLLALKPSEGAQRTSDSFTRSLGESFSLSLHGSDGLFHTECVFRPRQHR